MIVYKIDSDNSNIVLNEVVPASGGLCGAYMNLGSFRLLKLVGSTYLDVRFLSYTREKFGTYADMILGSATAHEEDKSARVRRDLMKKFGEEKTTFEFDSVDPIIMWLDDSNKEDAFEALGYPDGKFVIPAHDLHDQVFRPVIEEIKVHVLRQLDLACKANRSRPVDHIYMVGGFGCSNYLRKALVAAVEQLPYPPKIVKVDNAQQMISVSQNRQTLPISSD